MKDKKKIKQWQRILVALDPVPAYTGAIDGDPGPLTIASTKGLQHELGVPETGEPDAELVLEVFAILRKWLVKPEALAGALYGEDDE